MVLEQELALQVGGGSNLELVLTLRPGLKLGGWEPASAHTCREHSLFSVNNWPKREVPGSPLESQGIWVLRNVLPSCLLVRPCLDGWPPCLPQGPETVSQAFGEMLNQGYGSPALGWDVSGAGRGKSSWVRNSKFGVLGSSSSCSWVPGGSWLWAITKPPNLKSEDEWVGVAQKQPEAIPLRDQGLPSPALLTPKVSGT